MDKKTPEILIIPEKQNHKNIGRTVTDSIKDTDIFMFIKTHELRFAHRTRMFRSRSLR